MSNPLDDRRSGERSRNYAIYVTIMVNIATAVWAAATLNATVGELRRTADAQAALIQTVGLQVQGNSTDIAVLKDRITRGGIK